MKPAIPVSFNYAQALREIGQRMTYEEIAAFVGYESVGSIGDIITRGRIPAHPQGQAIWVLYRELFGKKPPMSPAEAAGVSFLRLNERHRKVRAA